MHVFVNVDLNGTIIAGDEMGGKSPNKSILTDLLECYLTESPEAFIGSLNSELQGVVNTLLGVNIDLQPIFAEHVAEFNHANFYDNFKHLLALCIQKTKSNTKLNDLLKLFLETEKSSNNLVQSMVMDNVLGNQEVAKKIREAIGNFYQHLDKHHILKSFYTYIQSIKDDKYAHVILNTFGNEAPKVVAQTRGIISCANHIVVEKTNSIAEKATTAQLVFNTAASNPMIVQQSNFEQYDEHGRTNRNGKLFPIDSSKRGVYLFVDDNLTFNGLDEKGCVNMFDVSTSTDIDFASCPALPEENKSPDVKAVVCGKAIVVFVRARLSNTCQDTFFVDLVNKYKNLANNYYQTLPLDTDEPNRNQLFTDYDKTKHGITSAGTGLQIQGALC